MFLKCRHNVFLQEVYTAQEGETQHPIRDLVKHHLRELLVSFGACMLNAVGFYAVLTYLPTYLETAVGMPAEEAQMAILSLI